MRTYQVGRAAGMALALLMAAAGCSSGQEAAVSAGPGQTASTSTSAAPSTGPRGTVAPCRDTALTPSAQAKYAGASLIDVVCDSPFAAATIRNGQGLTGEGVGFFRLKDGAWTLVNSGPAKPDPAPLVPKDFSTSTYNSWKLAYDLRTNPRPTTTRSATPTTVNRPTTTRGDSG